MLTRWSIINPHFLLNPRSCSHYPPRLTDTPDFLYEAYSLFAIFNSVITVAHIGVPSRLVTWERNETESYNMVHRFSTVSVTDSNCSCLLSSSSSHPWRTRLSTFGDHAFPVHGGCLWNTLLRDATSTPTPQNLPFLRSFPSCFRFH